MLLVDKLSGKPVYEQIIEGVERNILMGIYTEGGLLPSLRELSVTLGINPNTIQKAYAELIRREIIVPSPGSGTYVAMGAKERICREAVEKLSLLEELVEELALANVPKGDVLATVYAVYARGGREGVAPCPESNQKGGNQS